MLRIQTPPRKSLDFHAVTRASSSSSLPSCPNEFFYTHKWYASASSQKQLVSSASPFFRSTRSAKNCFRPFLAYLCDSSRSNCNFWPSCGDQQRRQAHPAPAFPELDLCRSPAPQPSEFNKLRRAKTGKINRDFCIGVLKDDASKEVSIQALNDLVFAPITTSHLRRSSTVIGTSPSAAMRNWAALVSVRCWRFRDNRIAHLHEPNVRARTLLFLTTGHLPPKALPHRYHSRQAVVWLYHGRIEKLTSIIFS